MVQFRRRQYLIQKGLQFRFARFVMLFAIAASLLTGLVTFYTVYFMLSEKLAYVYPQGRLVSILSSTHGALLVVLLVALPLIFYASIIFSHRIAGPLPKIYEALRKIGLGNFDVKLALRKNDELTELVNVINEMAANLKKREEGQKPDVQQNIQ